MNGALPRFIGCSSTLSLGKGLQTRRTRSQGGFALPLVIVLSLVAGILVASMLERQTGQRMTIARQTQSYKEQHFGLGVREVFDHWIKNNAGRSIRESLGVDSKVLDMELGDGTTIATYMYDAQGTLLTNPAGLGPDDAQDLGGALESLTDAVGRGAVGSLTRRVGPPSISVLSAPIEVLTAVCRQIAGGPGADDCFRELLALRDKPTPTPKDLADIATSLNLEEAQRARLLRLCAIEPTYYKVILDARAAGASSDSRPIARYEAYLVLRTPGNPRGMDPATGLNRSSTFVAWRKVDLP